jgi:hypothetical protein
MLHGMRTRLAVLVAVGALVVLAVVAARGRSGIPIGESVLGEGVVWRIQEASKPAADTAVQPVAYGVGLVILLVAVLLMFGLSVVVIAIPAIRFRLRRFRGTNAPAVMEGEGTADDGRWVAHAAKRALSEMDQHSGGPPGDAVIAAWVQLERDAAARGTQRKPHQTPSEFTADVLANHDTDPTALRQLRTLYHRARFGPDNTVTEQDVDQARRALEGLTL